MKVLLIKSGEIGQGPCRPHRQRHSLLGTLRWGHQQEQKAAPEPRGRALEAWGGACGPGSLWRPGRALPLWAPRSSQPVSKSVGLGGFPRHLAWLQGPVTLHTWASVFPSIEWEDPTRSADKQMRQEVRTGRVLRGEPWERKFSDWLHPAPRPGTLHCDCLLGCCPAPLKQGQCGHHRGFWGPGLG